MMGCTRNDETFNTIIVPLVGCVGQEGHHFSPPRSYGFDDEALISKYREEVEKE